MLHPIDVRYEPGAHPAAAVRAALDQSTGHVLCFLPGAAEINRAARDVAAALAASSEPIEIVELYGSLDARAQDRALEPSSRRRVILATNIAETSLTVPGVAAVVDVGLQKVARYDPDRAVDSLETERITQDAADQRAGRAGRLGPGLALRLWDRADRLRPHREPEIHRVDLPGPVLDVLAWGGDPRAFAWFEAPSVDRVDAAVTLLEQLELVKDGRLTDRGRRIQRLPISPRLSAILVAAGGARRAALSCAFLAEGRAAPAVVPRPTTTSDLLSAIERERDLPPHVVRIADVLQSLAGERSKEDVGDAGLRRALLAGYPDRVARRRAPESPRALLASGHGAVIGPESGVRDGEFFIALDVTAGRRGEGSEARVRMASQIDRDWLRADANRRPSTGSTRRAAPVRAASRDYYGAIVLAERPSKPEPIEAARLLAEAYCPARHPMMTSSYCGAFDSRACPLICRHSPRQPQRRRDRCATSGSRLRSTAGCAWSSIDWRQRRSRCQAGGRRASTIRQTDRSQRPSSCRNCSASPTRPGSGRAGSRSSSSCLRRTAARCRQRGICEVSGNGPTPTFARSCAAAIRGIPGPRIPGRRHRRLERSGRVSNRSTGCLWRLFRSSSLRSRSRCSRRRQLRPPSSDCSCLTAVPAPCGAYWRADRVFVGRVESIRRVGSSRLVAFTVLDGIRGVRSSAVEVSTGPAGQPCSLSFHRGAEYIVYASSDPSTGALTTNACSRTRPLDDAGADLDYVR